MDSKSHKRLTINLFFVLLAAPFVAGITSSCDNDDYNEDYEAKMELSDADFEGFDWNNAYGPISRVYFPADASDQRPANAEEFSKKFLHFDEDNELVFLHKDDEEYERQWGVRNEAYNQYYKGVHVLSTVYYLHFEQGKLTSAHGVYFIIKDFNFKKKISKDQAKKIFAKFWGISPSQVVEKEKKSWNSSTNIEYGIAMLPKQGKLTPYLIYSITLDDVRVSEYGAGIYGYVNAQTGKMVYASELVEGEY